MVVSPFPNPDELELKIEGCKLNICGCRSPRRRLRFVLLKSRVSVSGSGLPWPPARSLRLGECDMTDSHCTLQEIPI